MTGGMVRVTLSDGTRTQIGAIEIADVEPAPRGAILHLVSGGSVEVVQDARTITARLAAALAVEAPPEEPPAIAAPPPEPDPEPAEPAAAEPPKRRLKRWLGGRSSLMALMIGSDIPLRDRLLSRKR